MSDFCLIKKENATVKLYSVEHFVLLWAAPECGLHNHTIRYQPEEDGFLLSLAPVKVSSLCWLGKLFPANGASGLLVRYRNQ